MHFSASTFALPCQRMFGWLSKARTNCAGRSQAPRGCQYASSGAGGGALCVQSLAVWACSWSQLSGTPPRRVLPGRRRSRTPVQPQSTPSVSNLRMVCSMSRKPARERRDTPLSSCEVCGATTPTGKPDAPAAGASPASSTVTCQPRSANARAVPAPAMPEPMMVTVRSFRAGASTGGTHGPVACARSTSANSGHASCAPMQRVSIMRASRSCEVWALELVSALGPTRVFEVV